MSRVIIAELSKWVTTQDPAKIRLREQSFHVPVVPPDSIRAATDPRVCDRAAIQRRAHLRPGVGASGRVDVLTAD
jgi:hypothetical protein